MAEKKKIAAQFASRYRISAKHEKSKILDEYPALSGAKNRKYAIFKLNRIGKIQLRMMDGQAAKVAIVEKSRKNGYISPTMTLKSPPCSNHSGKTSTGHAENSSYHSSGKTLTSLGSEKNTACPIRSPTNSKKSALASSTASCANQNSRRKSAVHRTLSQSALLHRAIPTLTWSIFFQIDLIQHDSGSPSGEFCYTLTMTGVKTGWTVHFALMNEASYWVIKALDKTVTTIPMELKNIHSGTGSEFINEPVDLWCQRHEIHFSRGCFTHKNNNCYVE
jgi:hypothetical protein